MNDFETLFNKGLEYLQLSNFSKAIESFTGIIKIQPNLPMVYIYRGISFEQLDENDKALSDYNFAVNYLPDDYKYIGYYYRGFSYQLTGNLDNAVKDLTNAINLAPADPDLLFNLCLALYNRGCIYKHIKEDDKAFADFTEVLKINPDYGKAYDGRGDVFEHRGKYDEAISEYDKAIKFGYCHSIVYLNRGFCYLKKLNTKKAIEDFKTVLKIDPGCSYANDCAELINRLNIIKGEHDAQLIIGFAETIINNLPI